MGSLAEAGLQFLFQLAVLDVSDGHGFECVRTSLAPVSHLGPAVLARADATLPGYRTIQSPVRRF